MMDTLPERVESFYNDNKNALNEFVEFCLKNDIDYISDEKHSNKPVVILYEINGYFVYANNDITDEGKDELSEMIELCKNNNITDIYIDDENHQYVLFTMGSFLAGAGIEYWAEPRPIEDIKKEHYSDNAWYVDDNWVIME